MFKYLSCDVNLLNLWADNSYVQPAARGSRAAQSKVLCGSVSFSLLCIYNTTMATWLYFDSLKFDICDAMVFVACLLCVPRTGRFPRVH